MSIARSSDEVLAAREVQLCGPTHCAFSSLPHFCGLRREAISLRQGPGVRGLQRRHLEDEKKPRAASYLSRSRQQDRERSKFDVTRFKFKKSAWLRWIF